MMDLELVETPIDDELSLMGACGTLQELNPAIVNALFENHQITQNEEEPTGNPAVGSPISQSSEILFGSPQASNDKDSLLLAAAISEEDLDNDPEIEIKQEVYDGVPREEYYECSTAFDFEEVRGKYHVLEKIGEGTFSSVYKAITSDNQIVALKRIYPTCSPARILHEMQFLKMLGGLNHVAQLLGAMRYKDQVTLVLPYVEHQKFKDYLPLMTVQQIRSYMSALFESLQHLHRNNVIHRDVKPGNFLFNPQTNNFKLVDFGLAQHVQQIQILDPNFIRMNGKTRGEPLLDTPPSLKRKSSLLAGLQSPSKRQRLMGTPVALRGTSSPELRSLPKKSLRAPRGGTRGFRAPEVLLKCQNQTVAIDIWSAGVMLLCILSTRYPFFSTPDDLGSLAEIAAIFGTKEVAEIARLLNRNVRFPVEVSKTPLKQLCNQLTTRTGEMPDLLFNLLERCLDLNPNTRITAEEALSHPFLSSL